MKKTILTLTCFVSIFIANKTALATSGACSYHDGVNCSAGALIDGNAMCNDGTESTVSYSSMDECTTGGTTDVCSPAYNIQTISNYINQDAFTRKFTQSSIYTMIIAYKQGLDSDQGALNNAISSTQNDTVIQGMVQGEIQQINQEKQQAIISATRAGEENIDTSQYDREIAQLQQSNNNNVNSGINSIQNSANPGIQKEQACLTNLDQLYYKLQDLDNSCTTQYGQYAQSAGDDLKTCSCKDGYKWNQGDNLNTAGKFCVPTNACPANSTLVGNICEPNLGYIYKDNQYILDPSISTTSCPTNSTKIGATCFANQGYVYNNSQYISGTDYCRLTYGDNVIGTVIKTSLDATSSDVSCSCASGYQSNTEKTSCLLIPISPIIATNSIEFKSNKKTTQSLPQTINAGTNKNITVSSLNKIATSTIDSSTTIDIGAIPTSTTSDKEMLPSIPPKSGGFWSGLFRAFNLFNWFNNNN